MKCSPVAITLNDHSNSSVIASTVYLITQHFYSEIVNVLTTLNDALCDSVRVY